MNTIEQCPRRSQGDYSTIFTEPEPNNCFRIISELKKTENNGLKHKNRAAIVRLHTRMQPYSFGNKLTCTSIVTESVYSLISA